ncbi:MAG: hypothetical protein JO347_10385 [Candidatus Eremiobacteraeota bacterium]|nr:hypothetical protein [Candidatus Eremiobacteraeota bacterium]
MKIIVVGILLSAAGLVVLPSRSQAQAVLETSGGQAYFERAVKTLCGSMAQVQVGPDHAFVYLSGAYLQNRNLDEVARNLAIDGLNAFPESSSFSVHIEDSRGNGYAEVSH